MRASASGASLGVLLLLVVVSCGYRQPPDGLSFQGARFALKDNQQRGFYTEFRYGPQGNSPVERMDLCRALDPRRPESDLHNVVKATFIREAPVLAEKMDGTRYCGVQAAGPAHWRVRHHVTGTYKHGKWLLASTRMVPVTGDVARACDGSELTWTDLAAEGGRHH